MTADCTAADCIPTSECEEILAQRPQSRSVSRFRPPKPPPCESILTKRTPHPAHTPIHAIAGPPCEPILTQRHPTQVHQPNPATQTAILRATPHTTTTSTLLPQIPIQLASTSMVRAAPHASTIAHRHMADPSRSSQMSRMARILRHTRLAEYRREKPQPTSIWRVAYAMTYATRQSPASRPMHANICGDTHAHTYATCGRATVIVLNSPDTVTHACRDIRFLRSTIGRTMIPLAPGQASMPRHTPTNATNTANARPHNRQPHNEPTVTATAASPQSAVG